MNTLALASAVISGSDRQHPADQVLREVLKDAQGLGADDRAGVARAVFDYFRWRGWLDEQMPLPGQIEEAAQLAERFARAPEQFPDVELQARAVPDWTIQEMNLAPAWVRSLQTEPRLWLRARRGHGRDLAEKLGCCHVAGAGVLEDTLEYRGKEDLFRTAEFHAGEFEVQDLTSQAVGFICAPRSGDTWWDACAGEGGKTLHLSDLMENRGLIWATDRAAWRLQKLKRRAARARVFNYRTALWHEGPKLPTKVKFDGVLVDAPCSGLGTWQRNPHARWTTSPQDVQELAALQVQLLARAAHAVKPAGKLVYSVCTLALSETVQVADTFEKQFPGFEPAAVPNPLDPQASPHPRLSLWPQEFGGNGMFVAVWQRG
jgi:16S rRNA (cytosine967-C5)-methyltransferase